jgi:hypothetical protein
LRRKPRRALEDLRILAQTPVLPPQRRELLALDVGQAIAAGAGIPLGLPDPIPHRRFGQIEVAGNLPDRTITRAIKVASAPQSPGVTYPYRVGASN